MLTRAQRRALMSPWVWRDARISPNREFVISTIVEEFNMTERVSHLALCQEWMVKATLWNMPVAVTVAANWASFTQLPLKHDSIFYWWTPDPTFLELSPAAILFPPYDETAWSKGDKSTGSHMGSIDKYVSKDLVLLAPNVQELISSLGLMSLKAVSRHTGMQDTYRPAQTLRNFRIDLGNLDNMLLENKISGEAMEDTACRWLKNNPGDPQDNRADLFRWCRFASQNQLTPLQMTSWVSSIGCDASHL